MISHVLTRKVRDAARKTILCEETVTAEIEMNFDADVTGDLAVGWIVEISKIQSFFVTCDQECAITGDSSSLPQDFVSVGSFTVGAGKCFIWSRSTEGADRLPFTDDLKKLQLSAEGPVNIKIRSLVTN